MQHPGFFEKAGPFTLAQIARAAGGELPADVDGDRLLSGLMPLSEADPGDLTFIDNRKYMDQLKETRAGGCLVALRSGSCATPRFSPHRLR